MATLNKTEASMLRNIQQDAGWEVVLRTLKQRLDELGERAGSVQAETEFLTLRTLHKTQGGIEELKQFFEDLERGAFS